MKIQLINISRLTNQTYRIDHQFCPWSRDMRTTGCWKHTHKLLQRAKLKYQNVVFKRENPISQTQLLTGLVPFLKVVSTEVISLKSDANGA